MIKSIDGLMLPTSIDSTAELENRDNSYQAVGGKRCVELDPNPKWTVTAEFKSISLAIEYQGQVYAKAMAMRATPAPVVFINPYNGEETSIMALCTGFVAPQALAIRRRDRKPLIYGGIKVVFQEI